MSSVSAALHGSRSVSAASSLRSVIVVVVEVVVVVFRPRRPDPPPRRRPFGLLVGRVLDFRLARRVVSTSSADTVDDI